MNSIGQNFSSEFQWEEKIKFYEKQIQICEEKIQLGNEEIQLLEKNMNHKRKFEGYDQPYLSLSNFIENKERLGKNSLIMKKIEKLEHEKKVLSLDTENRIVLKVKNRNIKTKVPVNKFLIEVKSTSESDFGTVNEISFAKKKRRIIFHKKDSDKVDFYFDDINNKLADSEKSFIRKITKIGSDKESALKEARHITNNSELIEEQESLSRLHKSLPADPFFEHPLKHLGIQDGFIFGKPGAMNDKGYIVGTLFESDGTTLQVENIHEAVAVIFQLSFGLNLLINNDFINNDIKAENVFFTAEKGFPLGLRVVLADIDTISYEEIKKGYLADNDNLGFGEATWGYQPDKDWEKMQDLEKNLEHDLIEKKDCSQTLENIIDLRRKNMIALLGQAFWIILVGEWQENILKEAGRNDLQEEIVEKLGKHIGAKQSQGQEKAFCMDVAKLIVQMTDPDFMKRPTAQEVFYAVLEMVKNYTPDYYRVIQNKRWENCYLDW